MSLIYQGGKKNAYVQDGLQKIHTVFPDGTECVEEFHPQEQTTVLRRWRRVDGLGRQSDWEVEIGEHKTDNQIVTGLFASDSTPQVFRLDTEGYYVFKITNLPPPEANYRCDVEEAKFLVVRTSNKKYYKKLEITDLYWQQIPLLQQMVKLKHSNNTLMIFYQKPPGIISFEKAARQARIQGFQNKKEGECAGQ